MFSPPSNPPVPPGCPAHPISCSLSLTMKQQKSKQINQKVNKTKTYPNKAK